MDRDDLMPGVDADVRLARYGVEGCPSFLRLLKRHEGEYRRGGLHAAYRCPAGALTIGWGHNLDARPLPGLGEGSRISDEQASAILRQDLQELAAELDLRLPWWRRLGAARSAVLLDMAYNLGAAGLLGFRRMLEAARRGRFGEAASEMMDSRWAGQVGIRAVELAEQMRSGRWQAGDMKQHTTPFDQARRTGREEG